MDVRVVPCSAVAGAGRVAPTAHLLVRDVPCPQFYCIWRTRPSRRWRARAPPSTAPPRPRPHRRHPPRRACSPKGPAPAGRAGWLAGPRRTVTRPRRPRPHRRCTTRHAGPRSRQRRRTARARRLWRPERPRCRDGRNGSAARRPPPVRPAAPGARAAARWEAHAPATRRPRRSHAAEIRSHARGVTTLRRLATSREYDFAVSSLCPRFRRDPLSCLVLSTTASVILRVQLANGSRYRLTREPVRVGFARPVSLTCEQLVRAP